MGMALQRTFPQGHARGVNFKKYIKNNKLDFEESVPFDGPGCSWRLCAFVNGAGAQPRLRTKPSLFMAACYFLSQAPHSSPAPNHIGRLGCDSNSEHRWQRVMVTSTRGDRSIMAGPVITNVVFHRRFGWMVQGLALANSELDVIPYLAFGLPLITCAPA